MSNYLKVRNAINTSCVFQQVLKLAVFPVEEFIVYTCDLYTFLAFALLQLKKKKKKAAQYCYSELLQPQDNLYL